MSGIKYWISSITYCGYYLFFFAAHFSMAIIRRQHLFLSEAHRYLRLLDKVTQAIQQWLLDAVSSFCSLSLLLVSHGNKSYNTNRATDSLVTVIKNYWHVCTDILAVATIWGRCWFCFEPPIGWLIFESSVYSKKYGMRSIDITHHLPKLFAHHLGKFCGL